MSGYDLGMYPLEKLVFGKIRKKLVSRAKGTVLEIGIGTGANFPYYDFDKIEAYCGLDISISKTAEKRRHAKQTFVVGRAEQLPFAEHSFDMAVVTLVLCSVQDCEKALEELYRVLKPNGKLIFMEHILSNQKGIARFFFKVDHLWNGFSHCTLCRETDRLLENSPFKVQVMRKKAWGILCYGIAKKE